jgi:excisionase family DNA binding protein
MENLLSVKDAAQVLGMKAWTIYSWVREGKLPAVKLGRTVKISPAKLRAYILERETSGP